MRRKKPLADEQETPSVKVVIRLTNDLDLDWPWSEMMYRSAIQSAQEKYPQRRFFVGIASKWVIHKTPAETVTVCACCDSHLPFHGIIPSKAETKEVHIPAYYTYQLTFRVQMLDQT